MTDRPDEPEPEAAGDEGLATPPPRAFTPDDALVASDAAVVEAEYRDLLDDPNVRRVVARFLSVSEVSESTIGPIPPPKFLREDEAIRPGAADIVFERYQLEGTMARDEQLHRHAIDRLWIEHDIRQQATALSEGTNQAKRRQWFGFVLAALFLAAGVFVM